GSGLGLGPDPARGHPTSNLISKQPQSLGFGQGQGQALQGPMGPQTKSGHGPGMGRLHPLATAGPSPPQGLGIGMGPATGQGKIGPRSMQHAQPPAQGFGTGLGRAMTGTIPPQPLAEGLQSGLGIGHGSVQAAGGAMVPCSLILGSGPGPGPGAGPGGGVTHHPQAFVQGPGYPKVRSSSKASSLAGTGDLLLDYHGTLPTRATSPESSGGSYAQSHAQSHTSNQDQLAPLEDLSVPVHVTGQLGGDGGLRPHSHSADSINPFSPFGSPTSPRQLTIGGAMQGPQRDHGSREIVQSVDDLSPRLLSPMLLEGAPVSAAVTSMGVVDRR
ncbi:unnamed protein product, partial [Discosporangium mesarthrocarpum]